MGCLIGIPFIYGKIMSLSIYNYSCPSMFLRDSWNAKRAFNKNFSLRAWASQLGMSSHGTFYQIINGVRPLPKKYVLALSISLQLDRKEALYLETLIDFSKAKTVKAKSYYKERLDQLSPRKALSIYEIESFHFLKNPLNGAIIELTCLKDFSFDAKWIQNRLAIKATQTEIQKAINLLLELKLIKKDQFGNILRTNEHVYSEQDIRNEALQEYHKNVLDMAKDQISKQDVSKREFNATAMGIKSEDLPKIKEEIRDFLNTFIDKYEADPGSADEIYQLGIQFFGLTKS